MLNYDQDKMCPGGYGKLVQTENPTIKCSALPPHWRYNKALPWTFKVLCLDEDVKDGTRVLVRAGNEGNWGKLVLNGEAKTKNRVAEFHDLRFIGRSGRGKSFKVVITVLSNPCQVAMINNAIKVTVDGPRERRPKNKGQSTTRVSLSMGYYDPDKGRNPGLVNPNYHRFPLPIRPTSFYPTNYPQHGIYPPMMSPPNIYPSVSAFHPSYLAPRIISTTETTEPYFPINVNWNYNQNVGNTNGSYYQPQPLYSPSSLPRSSPTTSVLTEESVETDEESIDSLDIDIVGVEEEVVPVKCDLKAPAAKSTDSAVWRPY